MDFAAITDWVAYIRDCLQVPGRHPELGGDQLAVDAGLSKIGHELESTAQGQAFADAALELLEQGTPGEAELLLQIPLGQASAAGARVAQIAARWRGTPLESHTRTLLLRGLEADPRDPQLLQALDDFAHIDAQRARDALGLAVPYNIDWVIAHLDLLPSSIDPDGKQLRALAVRTLDRDLPALIAGMATAGADYVTRLVDALRAADAPPHQVAELRPFLAAHPAFAGQLP